MKHGTNVTTSHPTWWNDQHTSAWERVKDAMKRDWEQTKADLTKHHGRDLNQDAVDTVKQAVGAQPMPPSSQTAPVTRDEWDRAEPGVRFGYGARSQYADHTDWNDKLETRMRGDWDGLKTGRAWDDVKASVRHGWESAKRKV